MNTDDMSDWVQDHVFDESNKTAKR